MFGTHLGGGVVVKLGVAHTGKENGIGLLAGLKGLFGEGIAHLVYGMRATKCLTIRNLMAELLCHGTHHGHTLFHNLGADSVTGQHSNFQVHIYFPFLILYI